LLIQRPGEVVAALIRLDLVSQRLELVLDSRAGSQRISYFPKGSLNGFLVVG